MRLSDEVIIRRCLEGDGDAFSLLVAKYQNAVYGLCYHIVGNFADAQDLTQEAFVTAYLELPKLREPSRFARWLYRITVNICRMWLRDQKGGNNLPLEAVIQTEAEFADSHSPQEHAEAEELRLSITEAIASLSDKSRLAVTLYYIDGLSYNEIGDFLSVSPSAVKSRLHRARKQLKEELITMVEGKFEEHKEHAEAEELRLSITEAMDSLSDKSRLAVTLHYIDGLSCSEIGDRLSESPSAVKSRLHRARKQLKEELITMVEEKFEEHKLPEDFSSKVVQEVVVKFVQKEKDDSDKDKPAAPIVVLQSKADENLVMPIWIGMFEALAILAAMEKQPMMRPMTHDLMANMLKEFGMKVVRVVVTDLRDQTFYARITIESDGELREIDARPSDSIALALRTDAPIFVAKSVLSESGIETSGQEPPDVKPVVDLSRVFTMQCPECHHEIKVRFPVKPEEQEH